MFGWMAVPELSEKLDVVRAVVPTLILPLAAVSLILNALATFIAGLFGLELKWEGPKRLIEVLLKPKVLLAALLFNLFIVGGYYGFQYCKGFPSPLWYISFRNSRYRSNQVSPASQGERALRNYTDSIQNWNQHKANPHPPHAPRSAPPTLKQAWKVKLPRGVFGAVTLSGESAFVGSDDGNTYELDQKTGQILRRFYTGTPVTPSPIIWNSRLFIGEGEHYSHHCRIYSFDLKSGEFLGAFQTQGHTEGTPFLAEYQGVSSLFIPAGSDGIYAIDPLTLQERWHRKIGHADAEVRTSGSLVFVGTGVEKGYWQRSHRAFALDFLTGQERWKVELAESNWMAPALIGKEVCFGTGEIYSKAHFGQLSCFEQTTGKVTHKIDVPAPLLGIPVQLGDKIFTSDLEGRVCAYGWPSATKLWCIQSKGVKAFASVTPDGEGHLFYPTAHAGVAILDDHSGQILKSWTPTASEGAWVKSYSRTVQGPDGWFIADSTGTVRKLN